MKKIITAFLAILFFGMLLNCSSRNNREPHVQREWMLISFGDFTKDQLIKKKAKIDLTAEKEGGKIKGSAFMGCNRIFFTMEFKNKRKVKISGLGSTEMMCNDMNLETLFLESFEKMTKYSVDGHFLTLTDDKGNVMKFVAADWD